MIASRRYEILLPSRFNDGTPVPEALIARTLSELEERFGAVSCETQIIRGLWQHEGKIYRDNLARVFVDVTDTPDNRRFFVRLKKRLKVRFRQRDVWMTTFPIEVV